MVLKGSAKWARIGRPEGGFWINSFWRCDRDLAELKLGINPARGFCGFRASWAYYDLVLDEDRSEHSELCGHSDKIRD